MFQILMILMMMMNFNITWVYENIANNLSENENITFIRRNINIMCYIYLYL